MAVVSRYRNPSVRNVVVIGIAKSNILSQEAKERGDGNDVEMMRIQLNRLLESAYTDLFSIKNLSPLISLQDPFSLISLSVILIGSGTPFWNQCPAHSAGNLHGSVSVKKERWEEKRLLDAWLHNHLLKCWTTNRRQPDSCVCFSQTDSD